jgi:hypothetical protein
MHVYAQHALYRAAHALRSRPCCPHSLQMLAKAMRSAVFVLPPRMPARRPARVLLVLAAACRTGTWVGLGALCGMTLQHAETMARRPLCGAGLSRCVRSSAPLELTRKQSEQNRGRHSARSTCCACHHCAIGVLSSKAMQLRLPLAWNRSQTGTRCAPARTLHRRGASEG